VNVGHDAKADMLEEQGMKPILPPNT